MRRIKCTDGYNNWMVMAAFLMVKCPRGWTLMIFDHVSSSWEMLKSGGSWDIFKLLFCPQYDLQSPPPPGTNVSFLHKVSYNVIGRSPRNSLSMFMFPHLPVILMPSWPLHHSTLKSQFSFAQGIWT